MFAAEYLRLVQRHSRVVEDLKTEGWQEIATSMISAFIESFLRHANGNRMTVKTNSTYTDFCKNGKVVKVITYEWEKPYC